MAASLLLLAALFQHADGAQVTASGALRGLKDARRPMLLAGFSYWLVGLPIAWLFAFALDWRTPGIWVGMIVGLNCAGLLLCARFHILAALKPRVAA
jgi:MATE family multidrug resistance protein